MICIHGLTVTIDPWGDAEHERPASCRPPCYIGKHTHTDEHGVLTAVASRRCYPPYRLAWTSVDGAGSEDLPTVRTTQDALAVMREHNARNLATGDKWGHRYTIRNRYGHTFRD